MNENTVNKIKETILRYLSQRDFSEKALYRKLITLQNRYPKVKKYKEYVDSNIKIAINELKDLDIINDKRVLTDLYRNLSNKNYGINLARVKWIKSGFPKDLINEVLKESEEIVHDYHSIIKKVKLKLKNIEKKYSDEHPSKINIRLTSYIAQKGFNYDEIKEIIKKSKD